MLFSRLLDSAFTHPSPAALRAAQAADEAATLIDSVALQFGRFLRQHAVARLGCVTYCALLHVWLLVVIIHMAPSPHPPRGQ